MFLTGEFHHQIDEKSRIRIPARLKDALGESPVIMKGTNKCLFVFSNERASKVISDKFENNDFTDAEQTKALRLIMSSAMVAEEDKQGRILIPQNRLAHAGITKNVVTIGAYDRVEIWSEEIWNVYSTVSPEEYDEYLKSIAKKV